MFSEREINQAIAELPDTDHAGRSVLEKVKEKILAGAEVKKNSVGGKEITKIINKLDYDFEALHMWSIGELQSLKIDVTRTIGGKLTMGEIQTAKSTIPTNDFATRAMLTNIALLLENGLEIEGGSTGAVEIRKIINREPFDFKGLNRWIKRNLDIFEKDKKINNVEDFSTIVSSTITSIESKGDITEEKERRFLLSTQALKSQIQALGVTVKDVKKYEAYIGAKKLDLIGSNGLPKNPIVGKVLSNEKLTQGQWFFEKSRNIWGVSQLESVLSDWGEWTGYKKHESIQGSPSNQKIRKEEGIESVFEILIRINQGDVSSLLEKDVEAFEKAVEIFSTDINHMRSITPTRTGIKPEHVAGLKTEGWSFDSLEDRLGRDFDSEGEVANEVLEGLTNDMSISEIAGKGLSFNFEYTIVKEGPLNEIVNEMRNGPGGSQIDTATNQNYKGILEKLLKKNTRNIVVPLLEELKTLQDWQPGDDFDPYIRIGKGVDRRGNITSFQSEGPFVDPREKAAMIVMHLAVFRGLEEEPNINNFPIISQLVGMIYFLDLLTPFDISDDPAIIDSLISVVTWNIALTRTWKAISYGKLKWKFGTPRDWLRGGPPESENTNPEQDLEASQKRKIQDVEDFKKIADDIGDKDMFSSLEELGTKIKDDPWIGRSAAYSNDRFWDMKLFQIVTRRNGIYGFFFDNNSLRAPRIGGKSNGNYIDKTAIKGKNIYHPSTNLLNLDGTKIFETSPLFYVNDTVKLGGWKIKVMERYKALTDMFKELEDFEKYRLDIADDSKLDQIKDDIEKMRKKFVQGERVKLDASGVPERDPKGKLVFEKMSDRPKGDKIADFEKFIKKWLEKSQTGFDLKYGKALKADAIETNDRVRTEEESTFLKDLKKAEEYANASPDKAVLLQKIEWLREKLQEKRDIPVLDDEGKPIKENGIEKTRHQYSEHMTKTEFYERLRMILSGAKGHDKALNISNKTQFESLKKRIDGALSGATKSSVLFKMRNPAHVEHMAEKQFNLKNLQNVETPEGKILAKAQMQAVLDGNPDVTITGKPPMKAFDAIHALSRSKEIGKDGFTMVQFENLLKKYGVDTDKIGFNELGYEDMVEDLRAQTIELESGTRYYLHDVESDTVQSIKSRVESKYRAEELQKSQMTAKKEDYTMKDKKSIFDEVVKEMKVDEGSIKRTILTTLKKVF